MAPLSLQQQIERRLSRAILRLPQAVARALAGRLPRYDTTALDPHLQLLLKLERLARKKSFQEMTVGEARADLEWKAELSAPSVLPQLAMIHDTLLPGPAAMIPLRVYRPRAAPASAPALVYFHGGGWVIGSLESHDAALRQLAAQSGCVVCAVDYRLAPEHPFPAAVDDAVAAFRQVGAHAARLDLDATRLAVGGDSAGGNLAAVVTQATRGDPIRPCFQLLLYPSLDATLSFPSIQALGRGYLLEHDSIRWFLDHYLPPTIDRRTPQVSPLWADDFSRLPPALVLTAGFDPLRDEGAAYAVRLRDAGVAAEHHCYGSLVHGFLHLAGTLAAVDAPLAHMAAALRRALVAGPARAGEPGDP